MLKFILTFGTGFYCGLYAAQSHPDKVPVVAEPEEILRRIRAWLDEISKPKEK